MYWNEFEINHIILLTHIYKQEKLCFQKCRAHNFYNNLVLSKLIPPLFLSSRSAIILVLKKKNLNIICSVIIHSSKKKKRNNLDIFLKISYNYIL